MSKEIKNFRPQDLGGAVLSDVNICETAGFVDLETRFKRMEQNGIVANFFSHQFDTQDMRQIFLGDETEIYSDDDEETVTKKLALQEKLRQKYVKSILGDLAETNDGGEAPRTAGSSEGKPSSQNPVQEVPPKE